MSVPESKLPSVMQKKMADLKTLETAGQPSAATVTDDSPGNVPAAPASDTDNAPDNSTVVNFTREEANDLRAKAERTAAADARREMVELENAELTRRLTDAEERAKAVPQAPPAASEAAPGPVQVNPGDTALTADEQSEYEDSEGTISKIARREAAKLINDAMNKMHSLFEDRVKKVETGVQTATSTAQRASVASFAGQVKEKIANFDTVINHKHWNDFLDSKVPVAGIKYREALANAHHERSMEDMQGLFKTFSDKYIGESDGSSGYGSISTTDTGAPPASKEKTMLKMSERRKASEDFLKGRITAAELDAIKDKFTKADKEGRIDYLN